MNILIKSAIIVDTNSKHHSKKRDILIKNGVIVKIASKIENTENIKEVSIKDLHVSTGWFDT